MAERAHCWEYVHVAEKYVGSKKAYEAIQADCRRVIVIFRVFSFLRYSQPYLKLEKTFWRKLVKKLKLHAFGLYCNVQSCIV